MNYEFDTEGVTKRFEKAVAVCWPLEKDISIYLPPNNGEDKWWDVNGVGYITSEEATYGGAWGSVIRHGDICTDNYALCRFIFRGFSGSPIFPFRCESVNTGSAYSRASIQPISKVSEEKLMVQETVANLKEVLAKMEAKMETLE